MKEKNLKLNALFNFLRCFMNIIFPIISFPYASRILLPDGIGKVNFANSAIDYFLMLAALGISTYGAREASKVRDDKRLLSKFTKEILFFNLITTIISYLLFIITLLFVPKFHDYRVLLIVCSTKVLFTTLGIEWLYTAQEEFGYITARHTSFQIISLILLFTLVKTKDDYLIYAGIGVFANVGANIFNFVYSRKFINYFEKVKLDVKKHIKTILTFFGVNFAGKVNHILDTLMLGFLTGDRAVGLYVAAIKISQMVRELITSVIASFMPRSSYYLEHNKEKEYNAMIEKVFNVSFFFSVPATLGLFVLCRPLIILFSGNEYLEAENTMKLLSFLIVILSFNSFLNNCILVPNKKEKFLFYAQLIALFFNASLNYFLIKRYEVLGAGIATFIVETILPIVKVFPSWSKIKGNCKMINIFKTIIGALIMFAVILLISNYIENSIIVILSCTISGSIIYAIVELLIKHPTALLIGNLIKNKIFKVK